MARITTDRTNYPEWELTEQIIGLLYQAYNNLGYGYREKIYQRAFIYHLEDNSIPHKREQYGLVEIGNRPVGRYYIDVVVDNKVAVEFKVANEFFDSHIQQLLGYLKACNLRVGLLCLITREGVKIKRLVN